MTIRSFAAAIAGLSTAVATPALACSSCGCNLTSDWLSQGLVAQPGTVLGLRYDYVPQTQLRSGHDAVDRSAIALPAAREIEVSTYNHYVTASLDHAFNASWALDVQVPFDSRPHRTFAEGTIEESYSRTHGIGDVRATMRFQGFGGAGITGVQFGVKVPTGPFHQTFRSGPVAGEEVDRGIQVGTGTTDAILGAYHFGRLAGAFDYVLQGQGQIPLNSREHYRPGIAGTFSAGVHYTAWRGITPQLQLNYRIAERDHGAASDRPNSGGEQLYLAPGISAELGGRLSAFGFVHVPLYQRVNGFQLAPKYSLSLGVQYRL
jgi:hypothetical protein